MEFHEGAVPLSNVIGSPQSTYFANPLRCIGVFRQLVAAIQCCQTAVPRVVHRDIKPGNVLLLPDETVRLIDFGICFLEDAERITSVDENVGARNYCAYECEVGGRGEPGVYSDLYSAAKVLWSLVSNRRAFSREDPIRGDMSMPVLFPYRTDVWHFQSIFDHLIIQEASSRWQSAEEALDWTTHVRLLIQQGFPPMSALPQATPARAAFWDVTVRGAPSQLSEFAARIHQLPIARRFGDEDLSPNRRRISFETDAEIPERRLLDLARECDVAAETVQSHQVGVKFQAVVVAGGRSNLDTFVGLLSQRAGVGPVQWYEFAPGQFLLNFTSTDIREDVMTSFAARAGVKLQRLDEGARSLESAAPADEPSEMHGDESAATSGAREYHLKLVERVSAGKSLLKWSAQALVVLHLLPRTAIQRHVREYDLASSEDHVVALKPLSAIGWDREFNAEGFCTLAYEIDRSNLESSVQVYRNGVIEAVDASLLAGLPTHGAAATIRADHCVAVLLEGLKRYLGVLPKFNIEPPIWVGLAFLGVSGRRVTVSHRGADLRRARPLIDQNLVLPLAVIQEFGVDYTSSMSRTFDVLWQTGGLARWPGIPTAM